MIPFELDLTSTTFSNITIIADEIELTYPGKNVGFNLLDDEYFTISYVIDTTPNSSGCHRLPSQDKWNLWIIDINQEDPITAQGAPDELNHHQNTRGKHNVKIGTCRRKSYQRSDIEDNCSIFHQVRPVVSHLEFQIP